MNYSLLEINWFEKDKQVYSCMRPQMKKKQVYSCMGPQMEKKQVYS